MSIIDPGGRPARPLTSGQAMALRLNPKLLTPGQLLALDMASRGLAQKAIARTLNTTQSAVGMMLRRARGKLGAHSTAHAVRIALESGILCPRETVAAIEPERENARPPDHPSCRGRRGQLHITQYDEPDWREPTELDLREIQK